MFSNAFVALIIAGGLGVWIYNKLMRQTGGNTKSSLTGAAVSAGIIFLVVVTLVSMFANR
jgi:uncharacterized membrane protein SpoIIM required for sporulation